MTVILVIVTALWCVSVLSDAEATMLAPRGPVQGNPQEAVLEPFNSVNEPLALGAKRVRRQGPITIPCDPTTYTVTWDNSKVEAVDSDGNTVTGTGSGGTVQCTSEDSPPWVSCTTGKGPDIEISCETGFLKVATELVINEVAVVWNSDAISSPSDALLFQASYWNVGFRQAKAIGTFFEAARIGTYDSTVGFPDGHKVQLTYAAMKISGGYASDEYMTHGYD